MSSVPAPSSSSAPAIRVQGLSKEYRIGGPARQDETFRELIAHAATAPLRRLRSLSGAPAAEERFLALDDVSFEVEPGEAIGVIGRNGAGKSTLLKILTGITEPTRGRVELRGRVASLLEVGTGFHPELTGRENIFLNGAILGMKRSEIRQKFDEIVAFAEVERFLDTPVKHYSSGMYMRLAFAVAAHLEAEILLIDEVLAVGDVGFQEKCLGKMSDVARGGRTVLFVTHNMNALSQLCPRTLVLESGRIVRHGSTAESISYYLATALRRRREGDMEHFRRKGLPSSAPRIVSVRVGDDDMELPTLAFAAAVPITVEIEAREPVRNVIVVIGVNDELGRRLVTVRSTDEQKLRLDLAPGRSTLRCVLHGLPLTPGMYRLDVGLSHGDVPLDILNDLPGWAVSHVPMEVAPGRREWGVFHWRDVSWTSQA